MSRPDRVVSDLDARFNEEYLYFFSLAWPPERSEQHADLIVRLGALSPGLEVLDVPCGYGRIANRLAARGLRVAGLDASPMFLERARQDAAEMGVSVEYVEGDMRELPWQQRFDRLVCWGSSFGYFDDEIDRRVLTGFRRALRPNGRLLLQTGNLARQLRVLPPPPVPSATTGTGTTFVADRGEEFYILHTRYNGLTGRMENERLVSRQGLVTRHPYTQRIFSVPELRDWLLQAGFARVEVYAGDGGPFTLDSLGLVVTADS